MGMQQQRLAGFYKMQIDGSFVSYLAGSGHLRRGRDSSDATIFALMHDGTLKNVAPDGRQWFDVQAYNDECGPNGDKMGVYLKGLGWDHTIQDTWQPTKLIFEQVVESESDYSDSDSADSTFFGSTDKYGKPINSDGDSNSARGYSTFFGTVLAIAVTLM